MKISVITLGCPKNIVDSEYLMGGIAGDNIKFIDDPRNADVIVINTCAFIESARQESIEAIFDAIFLKNRNWCSKVFVTGCLPQRYLKELKAEIPEVDEFFDDKDFRLIANKLLEI